MFVPSLTLRHMLEMERVHGVRFLLGAPPYQEWHSVSTMACDVRDGSVLVVSLVGEEVNPEIVRLSQRIRGIRRSYPHLVFALMAPGSSRRLAFEFDRVLQRSGVRFLALEGSPTVEELRRAVLRDGVDVRHTEAWLAERLRPRGLVEMGVIRVLGRRLAGLPIDLATERQTRSWCAKLGLPPLRTWSAAGRSIGALVTLQGDSTTLVHDRAREAGYADGPTFSRVCSRIFGEPPTQLRQKVGWEWMLERLLARHR